MSHTTSRSVGGDKLAVFLQQTLGTLAEGYVVSLAELSYFKEERHQKDQKQLALQLKKIQELEGLLWSRQQIATELQRDVDEKSKIIADLYAIIVDLEAATITSHHTVPSGSKQCWQCHHISFKQSPQCEKCGVRDWWISW